MKFDPRSLRLNVCVPEHDIESPKAVHRCETGECKLDEGFTTINFSLRISRSNINGNSKAFLYVFHSEVLDLDIITSSLFLSN